MQALLASFDLHVLSVPPAFILSQDQTLVEIFASLLLHPPRTACSSCGVSEASPFLELLKYQVIDVGMYFVLTCRDTVLRLLIAFSRNNSSELLQT